MQAYFDDLLLFWRRNLDLKSVWNLFLLLSAVQLFFLKLRQMSQIPILDSGLKNCRCGKSENYRVSLFGLNTDNIQYFQGLRSFDLK